MSRDVVVIGAGFGGISTAILLARLGLRVTLVDGGPQPGGCLRSYVREGVDCPVGVHYIGAAAPGEVLGDFLDLLDIRPTLKLRRLGGSGIIDRYIFDDEVFDLPDTMEKFEATLARRFADSPAAVSFVSNLCRSAMASLRSEATRSLPAAPITQRTPPNSWPTRTSPSVFSTSWPCRDSCLAPICPTVQPRFSRS